MLVYSELSKQETRRMQLLGIPMFIVVVACSMTMGALWSILFAFVALIPYSFFYSKAYAVVAARNSSPPGWRFYTGVVLVQLAFIAVLVARARA
jgi:Ca2+/H+ antiporter